MRLKEIPCDLMSVYDDHCYLNAPQEKTELTFRI